MTFESSENLKTSAPRSGARPTVMVESVPNASCGEPNKIMVQIVW
jgi:hypothetical protein